MGNQSRIRSAVRHINVLNLLLLTIAAALAAHILPPLLNVGVSYTPPAPKKIVEGKEEKPAAAQSPSAMEYTVIADQNVFNPERKIPEVKKEEKPLPKPEFVLYGTLITDDVSIAFLDDLKAPFTTSGRGKRQKTLRIGNTLSGYALSEVYPDRVVMVRGEDRMELMVIDPSQAKSRDNVGSPAAAVAAVQKVPAAASPVVLPPEGSAPVLSRARIKQQRQQNMITKGQNLSPQPQ